MKIPRLAKVLPAFTLLTALSAQAGWAQVALPAPDKRLHHSIIHDTAGRRLILFGGLYSSYAYADVWEFSIASGTWRPLATQGPTPLARWGHSAIYDPLRDRMLVFGGFTTSGQHALADLWELSLDATPTWREIVPGGPRPTARFVHTAIYHSRRDRMIVYAGYDGSFQDDVWELPLDGAPSWDPLFPRGTPPSPRDAHVAVYDPVGDRMIVHGGFDGLVAVGDVWSLSLDGSLEWREIVTQGTPPAPRRQHAAAYDRKRRHLLVFGGTQTGSDPGFNDLWALPLGGNPVWQQLVPTGPSPASRWGATLTHIAGRDRFVLFGGVNLFDWQNDTWILATVPRLEWTLVLPPNLSLLLETSE